MLFAALSSYLQHPIAEDNSNQHIPFWLLRVMNSNQPPLWIVSSSSAAQLLRTLTS